MSAFDLSTMENMVVEAANETKTTPVPEGWYNSLIDSIRLKSVKTDNGDRPVLEVTHNLYEAPEELKQQLNRDKVTVRQDVWLDVTDAGTLAFGPNQNVGLGRLREACGENDPKKKFTFRLLEGKGPLKIHVTQKTNAQGDSFNNVDKIEKVA